MREQWARNIALLTGLLVVLLAMTFAIIQNPLQPTTKEDYKAVTKPHTYPQSDVEKQKLFSIGRSVYVAQRCAMCHSIAGEGNPRNPLDGIGDRRSAESIRKWIVGSEEIKDQLPASVFRAKQGFGNLKEDDLDSLVAYLQNLQSSTSR